MFGVAQNRSPLSGAVSRFSFLFRKYLKFLKVSIQFYFEKALPLHFKIMYLLNQKQGMMEKMTAHRLQKYQCHLLGVQN